MPSKQGRGKISLFYNFVKIDFFLNFGTVCFLKINNYHLSSNTMQLSDFTHRLFYSVFSVCSVLQNPRCNSINWAVLLKKIVEACPQTSLAR